MSAKKNYRVYLPRVIGGLVLLLLVIFIINGISHFIQEKPTNRKKKIQPITLLKPPPPPPPPPKQEKPPEPEVEEKIKEPEPELENLPDVSDEPPAGDLGLDAEGGAGSDAFGLIGRKGGRGLLSGDPKAWYAGIVKNTLLDVLSERDELRRYAYSVTVYFWFDATGAVQHFEIKQSSGEPIVDKVLQAVLPQIKQIDEPPPVGIGSRVAIRINNRM